MSWRASIWHNPIGPPIFFARFSGGPSIVLIPDPEQVSLVQRLFVQNRSAADGLFTPDGRFHCMPAEVLAPTIELFHHRRPPVFNNAERSEAS